MEFENQYIKCSNFKESEAIIKKAEAKVRETKNVKERQYYAQDILLEVEALLSCSNYNSGSSDCINCHSISYRYIQEYEYLAEDIKNKNTVS
jgi:hypothetical protein